MAKRSTHKSTEVSEREREDAVGVIMRDYYADVKSIGDDLISRYKNYDFADMDGFDTAMHETIDSARRVFITWEARLGLLVSENADAYFDEGIGDLDCKDRVPYEQLMFYALYQDVLEYMEREGFDPHNEDSWTEDEDEDDED